MVVMIQSTETVSPLSLALRNAIFAHGLTIGVVAERMGMTRTALNNRLTKANPLVIGNVRHEQFVRDACAVIGIDPALVLDEAKVIASRDTPIRRKEATDLVTLLLDTLENPTAEKAHKVAARTAIEHLLGQSPRPDEK